MGDLEGSSKANRVVTAREKFTDELGVPAVDVAADLPAPLTIGINSAGNLVWKTAEGETRESEPVDLTPLNALFPAVYIRPTATLSHQANTAAREIGTNVIVTLNVDFIQNDAGELMGKEILRDGEVIDGDGSVVDTIVLTKDAIAYQGRVLYGAGNEKKNPLGNFDPTGKILEGTINTNQASYRGYYFVGYGSVAAVPTSANARTLTGRLSNDESKFNLMANTTMQAIIVPPDMQLVSVVDLDALNIELFIGSGQYALSNANFTVNNAAGVAVPGNKLYIRTQGVPYSTPHRHQVTLKRI